MKNLNSYYIYSVQPNYKEKRKTPAEVLRKYASFLLLTGLFLFSVNFSFGQSPGDYRSNATTMNWSIAANWEQYNGTTWVTSPDYPGQNSCSNCVVTIRDANTVTLNVSPANSVGSIVIGGGTSGTLALGTGSFALTDAGNLTINAGATLKLNTATFTVNGTTSTAGTVTDASNTGINTFTGLVTQTAGNWTSTSVSTAANMIFTNGFTNTAGTFTGGAVTFGSGATILTTTPMSFDNTFTANGALNVNGNGGLTISGNNNTVAGNLSILANSSLIFNGGPTSSLSTTSSGNLSIASGATLNLASTGNLSIAGTTLINGTFIDNTDNGTDAFTGLITNNGTFNTDIVGTANNIAINGGFTNSAGAFFNVTSISLAGNINTIASMAIDGTVQTNGSPTTFASGTITITGTNSVSFTSLIVSAAASLTVSTTGTMIVTSTTNIAGTFIDNDNTSSTTFYGLLTVTGTCNVAVLNLSTLFINGGLSYTAGTFSCTGATLQSNGTTISNYVPLNFSNGINVTGGASITFAGPASVTVGGNVSINFPVSLTVSGILTLSNTGTVNVGATTAVTGSLTDDDNTSTTTFTGAFSSSGSVDFSVLSTSHLVFNGGIIHTAGTFNVPTATVSTNPIYTDIDVTSPIDFSGGVVFTGTGALTIGGAGGLTLSGSANVSLSGDLSIIGSSSLIVSTSGNFTVPGATSIGGNFTDNNNTGITTFTGLITKYNGAWISTAVTTPANMVFTSGFTQTGGSFNAGGASIPNGQTITSHIGPVMVFNNPILIGGAGDITITGYGGVTLAGTGINYSIPGNLTLTGTLLISTTGNFTVNGTTSITGGGAFTDNNNGGVTTFTGLVTHNSTGQWFSTAVTTAANMIFTSGFNNTAGTFSGGAATVGDNQTLTGTVNMSFSNGVTVLGNADLTIAGTSTAGVNFGGTSINYTLRNLNLSGLLTTSTSGNFTITGTTSISGSGAFIDNNNTGITTFTGLVTIGSAATFTTTTVTTVGNLVFGSGIVQNNITAGAFTAGAIRTSATQTWTGAGDITTTGVLNVNTGTLTNNTTGTVTSGGTLTGNIFVQGNNARLVLGSTTPLTITTLTSTTTGNTVDYRSSGSATIAGQTYFNLTISGSGNKTIPNSDIIVNGDLTITSGVLYNTTNNRHITLAGNWINNAGSGGFVKGTGLVTFSGLSNQTIGGNSVTTFNNLTISNSNGINLSVNTIIANTLNFTSGKIQTGVYSVIIPSTGTVTGAGQLTGWVNGNLQKNIVTGATSKTFEIGGASYYTPATVVFASVTTAGDLTGNVTATDHPNLAGSGVRTDRSVNRYWTFTNSGIVFTTAALTMNWVASDVDAGSNSLNFKVNRFNNPGWTLVSVSSPLPTSIQATGLTSFGDFAIGELCNLTSGFTYTGSPYCSNSGTATPVISGTAGTFTSTTGLSINSATGVVNLAASTPGTYTVTNNATSAGNCTSSSTATITITAAPTATLSYAASPYCSNGGIATVTFTGTTGGTFTSTAGLSLDASTGNITLATSTAGTYTVTYTVAASGGCGTFTSTASVQISASINNNSLDFVNGTHGVLCATQNQGGTAVLTAPAGTVFTTVNFASYGTPGGSCSAFSIGSCNSLTSQSVTEGYLLGNNSASIPATNAVFGNPCSATAKQLYVQATYTQPICSGTSPGTITSTNPMGGNGTYVYLWEISTTSSSSGFSSAPGTNNTRDYASGTLTQTTWFRRTVTSGPCLDVSKVIQVTVTPLPSATISYTASPYCYNGVTATVTHTGTTGGTYTSTGGLSINTVTGDVNLAASTPGTYTVTYTLVAMACAQYQTSTTIVINAATWTGAINTNWNNAGNWLCGGIPSSAADIVIQNDLTNYPLINAGIVTAHNITVQTGASITVDDGIIQIGGSISNSGIFDVTNGTVEMNGTSAQSIPANVFTSNKIKNLVISNDVKLGGRDSITGVLSFGNTDNKTFITNGNLTLKSSADGTARVADITNGGANSNNLISGNVEVERYIPAHRAWRLLTSPTNVSGSQTIHDAWQEGVNNASLLYSDNQNPVPGYGTHVTKGTDFASGFDVGINGNPSIKNYNNATGAWDALLSTNIQITDYPAYMLFVRGDRSINLSQGVNAPATNTTLRSTGELKSGDQNYNVAPTGFSVISNPFASAIDIGQLAKVNSTNIQDNFYVWDPKITGSNGVGGFVTISWDAVFSIYTITPFTGDGISQYIQSGAGFLARSANGTSAGTLVVKETDKTAAGSDNVNRPQNMSAAEKLVTNLYSVNTDGTTSIVDGVLNSFSTGYSNAVDNNDAVKLGNFSESISTLRDGQQLTVERRQPIVATDTIFFNMLQMRLKQYIFNFIAENLDQQGLTAYLEDNYLNTRTPIDLNAITSVSFTVTNVPGAWAPNRFRIVFRPAAPLPVTLNSIKAWQQSADIEVEWKVENETGIKQYEVEKSADGLDFTKSTIVTATVNNLGVYNWLDANAQDGNNYYRIKTIDVNGGIHYSSIVKVFIGKGGEQIVLDTKVITNDVIAFKLINMPAGKYGIRLLNSIGQTIYTKQIAHAKGSSTETLGVNTHLVNGIYMLEFTKPDNKKVTEKVIVE